MNPVKDGVWQQDDPCNDDWKFTIYIYIMLVPWWVKLSKVYTADHLENQQDCKTSIKIIVGRGQ